MDSIEQAKIKKAKAEMEIARILENLELETGLKTNIVYVYRENTQEMKKYKVLFCDMDGTLIETASGETFPKGIWDMKFKFNVLDAIKNLSPKVIFIVTNQGGIEKGLFPDSFIYVKCEYVNDSIMDYCNIETRFKYCGSNNRSNPMRKPNTGMLEELFNNYKIWEDNNCELKDCLMIGDASGLEGQFSDSDKKTAENFGIDYMDVSEFVNVYGKGI